MFYYRISKGTCEIPHKISTHALNDMMFIRCRNIKRSQIWELVSVFETPSPVYIWDQHSTTWIIMDLASPNDVIKILIENGWNKIWI